VNDHAAPPPSTPLAGVRVLDVGTLIAGPFGATLLGDFGAEVIKVEQPGRGDPLRTGGAVRVDGVALNWLNEARNKKSITLNLREPDGQSILRRLVAVADVLIENFTPGTLDGWGLGWDALHALNPRLVMVRVSGFGQTGPYSKRPGYDRIALGFSGYMYATGYPDRPPVRPWVATADYSTAIFGALATMLALYWRDAQQGGEGQMIDLALFEPLFRISEDLIPAFHRLGVVRERIGNRNPNFAPAGNYQTKEGRWIQIAAGGERIFERFARAMGRPELATDERFATARDRARNADALDAEIAAWIGSRTYDEVYGTLEQAGVPVGGILSVREIMDDPHYAARQDIVEVDHPQIGPVKVPAVIPKLSHTPGRIAHSGPALGAHNAEIYGGLLGMTEAELEWLGERGIV
jgi:crotonobetainyl-CoA:carnitine CoA-transferase CaiB-like acyl-CoA transferase